MRSRFATLLYGSDIWEALPRYHGSYSAAPMAKQEHLYMAMMDDKFHHVGRHIHFAGEAWDTYWQGWMEGAARSGEAAANYLLEPTKNTSKLKV